MGLALKNKNYLLIGGATGFGSKLGIELLKKEANVIVVDKSELSEEYEIINSGELTYKKIDLTKAEKTLQILNRFLSKTKIDGVVYLARGREKYPLEEFQTDKMKRDFDLNLNMFIEILMLLVKKKYLNNGCSVVTISSVCSNMIGSESLSYHTSKAALESATKYFACKLGPLNIRVNCAQLGFIVKDEHKVIFYNKKNSSYRKWAESVHPLQRVGHTDDVIAPILFLLGSESKFMTGQVLTIDGGLTLQEPSYLTGKLTKVI